MTPEGPRQYRPREENLRDDYPVPPDVMPTRESRQKQRYF